MNMVKKLACGVAFAAFALGAASAWAAGTSSYVQDGLIACWDGIENAGAGVHDGSATVWKDVKGGYEFALAGVTVDADSMTFAGTTSSYGTLDAAGGTATFGAARNGTMEIVYASRTGSGTQILLQSTSDIGLAFGFYNSSTVIPYTSGGATATKYSFTSGSWTNLVAVRYTSGAPASAIANGSAMVSSGNDTWGNPGSVTFIGKRASDAATFSGSIYCIRLYSRQLTDAEIAANQAIDQMRFIDHLGPDTLKVTTSAEGMGSPSPAYGYVQGLEGGEPVSVSCGNAAVTNANGAVYSCTGWKTFREDGTPVSSGPETSFTYTHPSPAEYRELQWQWEMTGSPTNYVSDGLIACWDGIENAAPGVHVDGTDVWKDIVGGREFNLTDATAGDNCMNFLGTTTSYGTLSATDTASTFLAAKSGTLEIAYRSTSGAGNQVLLQSTAASGLAFGIYGTTQIIPFSSGSQSSQLTFSLASGTSNNFVAVRYSSGAPVSALANGNGLAVFGSSSWSSPGTVTTIGHRDSKASGFGFTGSIYAIRLYSRQLTDLEIIENQTLDQQRFTQAVDNSRLVITSTPEGAGRPNPAFGYLTGLAAGDTRIVTCGGAITWTNAAGRVFACTGWKLYDANDDVVESGSTLSFGYTHPTPAAFRRLEWQWEQPMAILPIPDQVNESFDSCRPQFVVSNLVNGSTWTLGGDIVSSYFDVEYADNYNPGVATVTVTGKGEYEWVDTSASFNVIATKREDENVSTTDTSARRTMVNGNYVYVFTNAAAAQVVTAKRGIVLSDCLLVGGGGGGGFGRGGGGGGGGGVTNAVDIVGAYIDTDENFTVAVGAGGAGSVLTSSKGGNGGATSLEFGLFSATVAGGGGGGSWGSTAGANGASGGGGSQAGAGGMGIDGIGYAGADGGGGNSAAAGGGGGAGHAGYAADTSSRIAGNGGEGVANNITGVEVVYGGGGGGGGAGAGLWWKYDVGLGGLGGGGDGSKEDIGGNGVDGLGGGGGGGGSDGSGVGANDKGGGNGGAGTAILVVRPLVYVIVPIPEQIHESFDPCRPEFVVSNRMSGATWTVGGDIASPYFDVEYANNVGIGTASATITGKGEYAEANYTAHFNILATKYEDANLSTTDLSSRRVIVGGKSVYVFTNAASAQVVTAKRGIYLTDYLVVGGGGGGGCTMAGGGGAGGVTNATGIVGAYVDMNDTFTLAVGAGGAGSESVSVRGDNGGDTTLAFGIVNVRAYGGGGGGSRSGSSGLTGSAGGSGGGGAPNAAGGAGVDGQGFAGATGGGSNSGKSGGGGGAGHAGYVNVDGHSGYGGEGVTNDITGVEVVYGGGGGGGGAAQALFWKTDAGLGGLGGGGDGGKDVAGANGIDGLGGGGGGGGAGGANTGIVNKHGGRGGVGTVIFAVEPADFEIESIAEQYLEVGTGGCTPEPVVRTSDGLTLLTKDTDYTVSYTDNTKSGNAVITITGINDYAGKSCEIGFTIYRRYYVDSAATSEGDGSQASPFATIAYAITQANAAIAGGDRQVIIHAEDGTYPENGLSVSNQIVIEGNASDRTAVKIGKTGGRVFLVENADAVLRNLTVQNGQSQATEAYATAGGNIRLNAGMVTNCVVTGATVNGNDKAGANLFVTGGTVIDCLIDGSTGARNSKGQGVYMTNGHVVRCRIVNQIAGTDTGAPTLGVGVYMTGGLVENCLIAGNAAGNATLYMTGGTAVNCTIAGNTPRVADKCVGVNMANDAASVVNCVVFGNGGTALTEWANNSRGARFFSCASSVEITGGNNCVTLQSSSYLSYFEDNVSWVPFAGSPMMDTGDDSRYFTAYSQTDLLGNARVSPVDGSIDIGCYESDQDSFSFSPALVSYPSILSGATVDFAMMVAGASDTVTFEVDFGDGSPNLETTESSFTRQFDTAGYFHARARAKVGGGAYGEWVDIIQPIRVVNAVVYVSDAEGNDANPGTAAAPLKTVTMALNTLTNLLSNCEPDVDGVTIHVAAGTYLENALPKISSAMTIEGVASDRTAVKIGKTGDRIFIVENAGAVLRNLTVQNGQSVGAGGNIRLNAGMVTNCVISGATFDTKDRNGGNLYVTGGTVADCLIDGSTGARNTKGHGVYMTGGYVVRCRIVNQVAGYDTGAHSLGVGAYLTGGVIDNCLIAGNTSGIGALYMYGGKAVNCTVAGNTARAANQCIGIYVSASSSSVVNCVAYSNDTNTAKANFGDKNLNRYYYCGSSVTNESCATWTVLTDADFVSDASGNWRQRRTSKIVDRGTLDTSYRPADSSTTDLDGNPRKLNNSIDLGCWEVLTGIGSVYYLR